MKIVHICLASFFPDNYSYQENMLPKFHKKQGYDVEVIASLVTFDKNGKSTLLGEARQYRNEYDIKVTRLDYKSPRKLYRTLRRYNGFREALYNANPDILFIHGCQFLDIDIISKYAKTHNITIYVDNHADFSNSATNWLSKTIKHGIIWKHCAKVIEPYTKRFYGVLPIRVEFLKKVYGLPEEKCKLLVMGADDELVDAADRPEIKKAIRDRYNIAEDDFLIMTGGKIDQWKTQTLLLMEAVKKIENPKVKLIVFGSVTQELLDKVKALSDGKKIQYVGWIQSTQSYEYFAASDLVVFPGRHSVFWEQVAAQGIPMVCKYWEGTNHVDIGGNVKFLYNDSVDEIYNIIKFLLQNKDEYINMKKFANLRGKIAFSYEDIAKRALQE